PVGCNRRSPRARRRAPRFWGGRARARRLRQMMPVKLPTPLLAVSNPVDDGSLRVLGSGDVAFGAIIDRIRNARRSVEIRAFLWRDDGAGKLPGGAVLAAADAGAKGRIP